MTGEEAKECLLSKEKVIYNGITYKRISAIIYRLGERNNIIVSAELLDNSKNSVTIALLKDVLRSK